MRVPYRSPYCLRCYTPLARGDGAATRCPACDAVHLRDDQHRFWTREPRLVALERGLKGLVTAAALLLSALILANPSGGTGSGHGWAAGLPILLGALGWDAASRGAGRRGGRAS